jgi:hypothetical protein
MKFEEAFSPAMQKKVQAAIQAALKETKPRPAVDRVLTVRATGKWTHYAQLLLAYGPGSFGVLYVNLDTSAADKETGLFKTLVHGPESKAGKHISAKELRREAKAEKALARKKAKAEKAKAAEKVSKTSKVQKVKFDPKLSTLDADGKATPAKS